MKRLSIGERLKKAKSLAVRREIALDWMANWIEDYEDTVRALDRALARGDIPNAGRNLGQLLSLIHISEPTRPY